MTPLSVSQVPGTIVLFCEFQFQLTTTTTTTITTYVDFGLESFAWAAARRRLGGRVEHDARTPQFPLESYNLLVRLGGEAWASFGLQSFARGMRIHEEPVSFGNLQSY